ncbi:MAG: thiosulfate/3-mercaptopyruvate sulfurtransferase [Candidatus Azotimanducaceae bacterium]|jgi:thiosulfate/3-mercaptopyruvate sulfurtransferase
MSYSHPEYLISTDQLADAINYPTAKLRLFDVTVTLVPASSGYRAESGIDDFQQAHIPAANFMDLTNDFSDTTSRLGFTLPSAEHLQAAYRAAGIDDDSQVVFYSSGHMMWATRAWWMLNSCGHTNVAVLDGGFGKWKAEDRRVEADHTAPAAGNFSVNLDRTYWTDKTQTAAAIDDGDVCTINALSPGVYSGNADMSYGRKGHIQNSKNVFYDDMLQDGCFKPAADLEVLFKAKGVLDKPKVIAYCGGGISATIDALALKLMGHNDVAVYDGSMSEWVKDESLALIIGDD